MFLGEKQIWSRGQGRGGVCMERSLSTHPAEEGRVWLLIPRGSPGKLCLCGEWSPEEGRLKPLCRPLQPLCPKELWHFVHQCYGNELGLTSDDEDYVPPDDDFNTMG